jgi:acetolactate synthase I/II/III large subunit
MFDGHDYIQALNKAKRPVILAGYGVRAAHAVEEFRSFIQHLNIPVLLTWKAIDLLPDDHPLYCGRPGSIGQRAANIIQQKADFILVLGARLDPDQVGFRYDMFAPNAKRVQIDIDPEEFRKYPRGFVQFVVDDLKHYLNYPQVFETHNSEWLNWCKELNNRYPAMLTEHLEGGMNIYKLSQALSDACTGDDVLAIGSSGPSANIILQTWKVKEGQRFIFAPALGAMGTDIPGAIGACLASGRKRTICVTGDGGFQLNAQELEVVRRLNLPIKIFVIANGGYGSIAMMQDKYFGKRVGADKDSGFTMPSIYGISATYGVNYARLYNSECLPAINELAGDNPIIIEVKCPLTQEQTPRIQSQMIDGKITSLPMEDMYPTMPELAQVMGE